MKVEITMIDEQIDQIIIDCLTSEYVYCYEETDEDGELFRDAELMPQLKTVIFHYLNPLEQDEFNQRFPL